MGYINTKNLQEAMITVASADRRALTNFTHEYGRYQRFYAVRDAETDEAAAAALGRAFKSLLIVDMSARNLGCPSIFNKYVGTLAGQEAAIEEIRAFVEEQLFLSAMRREAK